MPEVRIFSLHVYIKSCSVPVLLRNFIVCGLYKEDCHFACLY